MKQISQMIAEALGTEVAVYGFDGAFALDFGSAAEDHRRRNPPEPQRDAVRPSSGAFRISELPAAPPAM